MKNIPCSYIGRVNIVKKAILQSDVQIHYNPNQNLNDLFAEMETMIIKFKCNFDGAQIAKTILKKDKIGRPTPPDFKTYQKRNLLVIKTVCGIDIKINGIDLRIQKFTRTSMVN